MPAMHLYGSFFEIVQSQPNRTRENEDLGPNKGGVIELDPFKDLKAGVPNVSQHPPLYLKLQFWVSQNLPQ